MPLLLTREWFEAICYRGKKEEYRALSAAWASRLSKPGYGLDQVVFRNGYQSEAPTCTVEVLSIDKIHASAMNPKWSPSPGSVSYANCFKGNAELVRIKLGAIMDVKDPKGETPPEKQEKAVCKALHADSLQHIDALAGDKLGHGVSDVTRSLFECKDLLDDRMVKPGKAKYHVPDGLLNTFINTAWKASSSKEFMGWLLGLEDAGTVQVLGLYIPSQKSSDIEVWELDEGSSEMLAQTLEKQSLQVVGWIHSHPTFDAFLSSTDMHMQCPRQSSLKTL